MTHIVQEALALVNAGLAGLSPSSPNRQFGLETMVTLQEKFHSMLLQERLGCPMPLDQNEIILLHTAMLVFSHSLQHISSIDRRNAFHICQEVREQLPPLPFPLPVLQYNHNFLNKTLVCRRIRSGAIYRVIPLSRDKSLHCEFF